VHFLGTIDYIIIIAYVFVLLGIGVYLQRRASGSLEDYFLGGRKLPWWALGTSGMAGWLDITGTMLIVSFLYMLGPRGLYVEFRGGAVLVLAFMLVYAGKWHRRSGCITAAEWNIYRFGGAAGGQVTRMVGALAGIAIPLGLLGYLAKGVGLFLSVFLPFSPTECALLLVTIATIYTLTAGFYGVVVTDVIQSVIIVVAAVFVSVLAATAIAGHGTDVGVLAAQITGNAAWTSSQMAWHAEMPAGYEQYSPLFMFAMLYLLRNVIVGMGSGGESKYFGARNERECGLMSFLLGWLMMLRWPMMMGFAVLGLFLVHDTIPDQSVLPAAAELIQNQLGPIAGPRWEDVTSAIINAPARYPELVGELQMLLGEDWPAKLKLLSVNGTINPERIMPAVLLAKIPEGMRGIMLIALLAASMSTFDTVVNQAAAFFTRDIYQGFLRPKSGNRELMIVTYVFIVVLVVSGLALGYASENVNKIWSWFIMALGAGLGVPAFLRLYWWRFNAGGVIASTLVGLVVATVQYVFFKSWNDMATFVFVMSTTLAAAIIGTLATKPTPDAVLEHFYRTTRPFGVWGPYKRRLAADVRARMVTEHRNDIIAIPFTLGWQVTLFLLPMQLLIGAYQSAAVTGVVFLLCLAGMYVFWYRVLPPADQVMTAPGKVDAVSRTAPR
jgi:SSS family solute:Na+ symporter